MGKTDLAIQAYDKAIAINPTYALAWYNKGIALDQAGNYSEAASCYAKAKELGYEGS
jgi:tetratricopeptide (TPR) repeat protein